MPSGRDGMGAHLLPGLLEAERIRRCAARIRAQPHLFATDRKFFDCIEHFRC
jgi:hypothetical protein